jgi:hypothetical protein
MTVQLLPGLESCVGLDLCFTPATNPLQLCRLALKGTGDYFPVFVAHWRASTCEGEIYQSTIW